MPLALCGLLAAVPAAAQSIVRWDASRIDQPGQRSLYLRTPNGGRLGLPVAAGDVDGDGRQDYLLCALAASEAFLFFSPPGVPPVEEAMPVPGVVTRIAGAATLGVECSAGDVNGDGLDDLVLGAPSAPAPGRPGAGVVYVVFGSPALPAEVDVEEPGRALKIVGRDTGDHLGVWVAVADVDGDGVEDILMGAPDADGPGNVRGDAGEADVFFGGPDLAPGLLELSAMAASGRLFTVFGADAQDGAGSALAAGRIDGGPVADLVVGSGLNRAAQQAFMGDLRGGDGPNDDRPNAGEAAIVFDPQRGQSVDLAAPPASTTFVFGADPGDFAGEEVDVGDADGDGFGDVLVGALTADGPGNVRGTVSGEAYLVYGGDALHGARIDLAAPPAGVTTIFGPSAGGITGDTARLIDIDGDGRFDVFIGSPTGTFLGADLRPRTGGLFFIRTPAGRLPAVIDLDHPSVESLLLGVILAADPGDILSYSVVRAASNDGQGDDVVVNGMTGDGLDNRFMDAGEAYVLQGQALAAAVGPFASGDVNADGAVDLRDLHGAIVALVQGGQLSAAQLRAADTNGNGLLDEGDVVGLVDRVLFRNFLASGPGRTSGLAKSLATPGYRYGVLARGRAGGSSSGSSARLSAVFSLSVAAPPRAASRGTSAAPGALSPAAQAAPGAFAPGGVAGGLFYSAGAGATTAAHPNELGALLAVFALPAGAAWPPPVVPISGVRIFTGVHDGRLRVLVLSDGALPLGRPLFGFRGPAPPLERASAATLGGSLRMLRQAPGLPASRSVPPAVRKGDPRLEEP